MIFFLLVSLLSFHGIWSLQIVRTTTNSNYLSNIFQRDTSKLKCTSDKEGITPGKPYEFTLDIKEPITLKELSNSNLIKIVNLECTDQECNNIAWKCLGYVFDENTSKFTLSPAVFPKWAAKYPEPPDLIGITRDHSTEVDKPVRDASMNLMRSIPRDYKGGVRALESEGFKGFKLKELTPNKTRRAQLVNWMIYYREKLFGKTIEQLKEERLQEVQKSQELSSLPSEKQYEKLRLDVD
jgi:hypothetical protein|mmetsp:Transcript_20581/g.19915  ORF Transcript_20581/g.19915 Transcript_20581/m.19915 type:complete len:239 (+) Transcript_20581:91-807(+)